MKDSYCTLFDKNYLDKGIVMIDSLFNCAEDIVIYVLAMDDLCVEILHKYYGGKIKIITINELEEYTQKLKETKKSRTRAEYCWTCTPCLIEYIIKIYSEYSCTYIDSDLYFWVNPHELVCEMYDNGKTVQIVRHWFGNNEKSKEREIKSGKYCVQFNTFCNERSSLKLLEVWKNQCLECCSMVADGKYFGDQKYLDNWSKDYNCVNVLSNKGGGVAPWNLSNYKMIKNKTDIYFYEKNTKEKYRLFFYHFHNLEYQTRNKIKTNIADFEKTDLKFYSVIYYEYLLKLDYAKNYLLQNYNFYPFIDKHPGIKREYINQKKRRIIIKNRKIGEILSRIIYYLRYKNKEVLNVNKIRRR